MKNRCSFLQEKYLGIVAYKRNPLKQRFCGSISREYRGYGIVYSYETRRIPTVNRRD